MFKKIATWVMMFIMISVFVLDIISVAYANHLEKRYTITDETFAVSAGADRIHFLNTGASDAILIESNGHFALIDSGEGDNNPRRKIAYRGYEKDVILYLKETTGDKNGKVHLDFILGTHCHYDHIGAFEAIIRDEDITIDRAYFKEYNYELVREYESGGWANDKTYREVLQALAERSVPVVSDLPEEAFAFGDFTLQLFNTVTPEQLIGHGENASCVGVKVTKGDLSAFLAADITSTTGLEPIIAAEVGEVTLLKAGHHGYFGSSSMEFLGSLKPKIVIVTNQLGKIYPNVKWNLTMYARVPTYATVNCNGIIADLTDSKEMKLTQNIQSLE